MLFFIYQNISKNFDCVLACPKLQFINLFYAITDHLSFILVAHKLVQVEALSK